MDDPSAVTNPVINGYYPTDGVARLNGIHQVDSSGPSSEILA